MLKRLYHWTLAKAAHPLAERWLALISFMESSFFPIPPDVLLAPMALARPLKAFRFAAITTITSVLGAALGWVIGASLFDTVGTWLLSTYGAEEQFASLAETFNSQAISIVFLAAVSPVPFKIFTIASGATGFSLWTMLAISVIGRGLRFFLLAGLLRYFGEPMKALLDRHFGLITTLIGILFIGGFVAAKYLI
ncbi:DedA family protein [Pacificimonas sp. WHA3]|uniref:DedA family protein n=2 Tax=Pacificimonas pallii TaxID=2827236 RepID=A0ABS6SEA4_9SPHN|nr:DedA family protein [Pacificimonas pallii]